ncbi:hypothetical protein TRVA0_007S02784 [Trichomonascus vanleenenianus]|uniref:Arp10p n=1 Tax=Trichomonascus vanleenenianus TaxID=2268995 RepID=UPI003EC9B6CC
MNRRVSARSFASRLATPGRSSVMASPSKSPAKTLGHKFSRLSLMDTDSQIETVVILYLGQLEVSAGFPGDSRPRSRFRSNDTGRISILEESWYQLWQFNAAEMDIERATYHFEALLKHIFTKELLVDMRNFRIVVLEPTFMPVAVKRVIANTVLGHFRASSLMFMPLSVCSVLAAGGRAGLTVEVEWDQTTITPVYDLRELLPQAKCTTRSLSSLFEHIARDVLSIPEVTDYTTAQVRRRITKYLAEASLDEEYTDAQNGVISYAKLRSTLKSWYFGSDSAELSTKDHDDEEKTMGHLIGQILRGTDAVTRGEWLNAIIVVGPGGEFPVLRQFILQSLAEELSAGTRGPRLVSTLGPWAGASLYISSIGWFLVHEEKARMAGEMSRERYANGERWIFDEF